MLQIAKYFSHDIAAGTGDLNRLGEIIKTDENGVPQPVTDGDD